MPAIFVILPTTVLSAALAATGIITRHANAIATTHVLFIALTLL